jgi:hypothetical protein
MKTVSKYQIEILQFSVEEAPKLIIDNLPSEFKDVYLLDQNQKNVKFGIRIGYLAVDKEMSDGNSLSFMLDINKFLTYAIRKYLDSEEYNNLVVKEAEVDIDDNLIVKILIPAKGKNE